MDSNDGSPGVELSFERRRFLYTQMLHLYCQNLKYMQFFIIAFHLVNIFQKSQHGYDYQLDIYWVLAELPMLIGVATNNTIAKTLLICWYTMYRTLFFPSALALVNYLSYEWLENMKSRVTWREFEVLSYITCVTTFYRTFYMVIVYYVKLVHLQIMEDLNN